MALSRAPPLNLTSSSVVVSFTRPTGTVNTGTFDAMSRRFKLGAVVAFTSAESLSLTRTIATTPWSSASPPTDSHGSSALSEAALIADPTASACRGAHPLAAGGTPSPTTCVSNGVLAAWATIADVRAVSNFVLAAALGHMSRNLAS